jgi:protein-disulfide isomerase
MLQLTSPRLVRVLRASALIAAVSVTQFGCKKEKLDAADTEAVEAKATGGGSSSAGACTDYATQVCGKAGDKSSACQTMKAASDLMSDAACKAGVKDIAVTLKKLETQRSACDELVQKLCAAVGEGTESCTMVKEQSAQFPPERCKEMLPQTDKIAEDLKKREAANLPLTPEQQKAIADDTAPSFGPADAKVTVVEFSDFECPYCSKAAEVVTQIKQTYGDKVRFVFRQFPLSFHQNAHAAAQASLAAHAEGKFWEFHDKLFENQRALDRASLEQHAKDVGVKKLASALDSKTYAERVDADLKLGSDVAVQGTPTLFVNGKRVANPTDFAMVKSAIDAAL